MSVYSDSRSGHAIADMTETPSVSAKVATWQSNESSADTPECMVHNIFEGAMSQALGVVEVMQQRELKLKHQVADLESVIDTMRTEHESALKDMEMNHAEASALATQQSESAFDKMKSEMTARVAQLEAQLAEERESGERALVECDEAWRQRTDDVEEIWTKKYSTARKQVEKANEEIRKFKQKTLDVRHQDLEALETSGKSMGMLMEEAMRLIRQAQEDSTNERLRIGRDSLLTSLEDTKENADDMPSPSSIRAQYSRKLSVPATRLSSTRSIPPTSPRPLRAVN